MSSTALARWQRRPCAQLGPDEQPTFTVNVSQRYSAGMMRVSVHASSHTASRTSSSASRNVGTSNT
jgi:hypothetical protein